MLLYFVCSGTDCRSFYFISKFRSSSSPVMASCFGVQYLFSALIHLSTEFLFFFYLFFHPRL